MGEIEFYWQGKRKSIETVIKTVFWELEEYLKNEDGFWSFLEKRLPTSHTKATPFSICVVKLFNSIESNYQYLAIQ